MNACTQNIFWGSREFYILIPGIFIDPWNQDFIDPGDFGFGIGIPQNPFPKPPLPVKYSEILVLGLLPPAMSKPCSSPPDLIVTMDEEKWFAFIFGISLKALDAKCQLFGSRTLPYSISIVIRPTFFRKVTP